MSKIKVAISEFGLSVLMLISFNNFMFIKVMRYLHDNKGLEANKTHFTMHKCKKMYGWLAGNA